jgi:hypothetical protein
MRVIRPASDRAVGDPARPADREAFHVPVRELSMFASTRPTRWVAALALVVVASTTSPARSEDVFVQDGVYVKQLPPWRQRLLQKKMLRQSGSEVIIEAPPAITPGVRVPGPLASRRSMRPLFGPPRVPARIISPSESIIVPGPKVITTKPGSIEPSAPIISGPSVVEEDLDELPPVDLPTAKTKGVVPAPGEVISSPASKPTSPPIGLDPEPPLEAPASPVAPATGSAPRPKRSA